MRNCPGAECPGRIPKNPAVPAHPAAPAGRTGASISPEWRTWPGISGAAHVPGGIRPAVERAVFRFGPLPDHHQPEGAAGEPPAAGACKIEQDESCESEQEDAEGATGVPMDHATYHLRPRVSIGRSSGRDDPVMGTSATILPGGSAESFEAMHTWRPRRRSPCAPFRDASSLRLRSRCRGSILWTGGTLTSLRRWAAIVRAR
jgi:hypothetical protein